MTSALLARGPYRVAVCGVSRSVEQLELALELESQILVQQCGAKKLDAQISVDTRQIEAYAGEKLLFSEKREGSSKRLIAKLIAKLGEKPKKPEPVKHTSITPPLPAPIIVVESEEEEPVLETPLEETGFAWELESLASVDQWSSGLSSRAYPGVQIRSDFEIGHYWHLEGQFAFGTSAFRVDDQIAWNQQFIGGFLGSRRVELGLGFSIGFQAGYFYWVSLSGNPELPNFQRHDAQIGALLIYQLKNPDLEIGASSSFLPVHLGMQNQIFVRYYFVPNWYASAQGRAVNLWVESAEGSFLSASLGLGYAL